MRDLSIWVGAFVTGFCVRQIITNVRSILDSRRRMRLLDQTLHQLRADHDHLLAAMTELDRKRRNAVWN